jgi:hypothetical protein
MADIDVKEEREKLERLLDPPVPMKLLYKIFIVGTIGTFLAIITVGHIHPEKVPQIIFTQQQTNENKIDR